MGALKKGERPHKYVPQRGTCRLCGWAKSNQRHDVVVLSKAEYAALINERDALQARLDAIFYAASISGTAATMGGHDG